MQNVQNTQNIMAYVEELTRRAAMAKPTPAEPTPDPDMAQREAALSFVNHAGARLVAGCPCCYPEAPVGAGFVVLVPAANDGPAFRQGLAVLRIPYAIVPRRAPLAHLPARCGHVGEP